MSEHNPFIKVAKLLVKPTNWPFGCEPKICPFGCELEMLNVRHCQKPRRDFVTGPTFPMSLANSDPVAGGLAEKTWCEACQPGIDVGVFHNWFMIGLVISALADAFWPIDCPQTNERHSEVVLPCSRAEVASGPSAKGGHPGHPSVECLWFVLKHHISISP